MKKVLFASAAAAALTLSLPTVASANCADEIAALHQELGTATADAGAAAFGAIDGTATAPTTSGTATAGTAATTPPPAGSSTGADTSAQQSATAGQEPGTEATPAMGEALAGGAASAQDVIAQDTGQPTAAAGAAGSADTAAADTTSGTTTNAQGVTGGDAGEAGTAILLARAEEYQKLGNENACMNVIEQIRAQQ